MQMRAPIVSQKFQRNEDITYVGANANNIYELYEAVATSTPESGINIHYAKKVFSINLSVNFLSGTSNEGSTYSWMVVHLRADQVIGTLFGSPASTWSTIGNSPGRNQVIKSFMGVVGTEDAGSVRYNNHIPIPKMWHRLREGDKLSLVFNASEAGTLSIGSRFKAFS